MDNVQYINISSRAKDITGLRSGKLVALGPIGQNRYGLLWQCQCDCGNESIVRAARLIRGEIRSCGCVLGKQGTHLMTNTKVFSVWNGMRDRCSNVKNESYPHYGERGITVCAEWTNSFEAFYEHVSKLPHCGEEGYSIDRINNDGNYEPGNVQWATLVEQRRNQRNNRFITIDGVTRTAVEWAEIVGIASCTIRKRLNSGWSEYDAVFKPIHSQKESALLR